MATLKEGFEGLVQFCVIILCVNTRLSVDCYRMPNLTLEAKYPSGFRVFIPDQRGIEEFGFNANINEPLVSYEPGEISGDVKEKTGRFWIFQDDEVELEPGDALYYWAYVVFRGVVYKRNRQKWVCINFVREFSNITLPRDPGVYPKVPSFFPSFKPFPPMLPQPSSSVVPPFPKPETTKLPSPSPKPEAPPQTQKKPPLTTTISQPKTTLPPTTTVAPPPETTLPPTTTMASPPKTTLPPTTTMASPPETTLPPTTTMAAPPETTTVEMTTTERAPETTTPVPTTTAEASTTQIPTTTEMVIPVTSGPVTTLVPDVTPDFCNESVPTDPPMDTISTTMSPEFPQTRPYGPPVYWPSSRDDCLNVWAPSYQPSMTTLKLTKSVILLECQAMSQKRKMSRLRSEVFSLSKFNYDVEARLDALEKKVFHQHP